MSSPPGRLERCVTGMGWVRSISLDFLTRILLFIYLLRFLGSVEKYLTLRASLMTRKGAVFVGVHRFTLRSVQVARRQVYFGVPRSAPSFVRAESPTHNLLHALHSRARRSEEREGNIRSGATGCFWRPLPAFSLSHSRTQQHAHTHSPLFCRAAFHHKFNLRFRHASPSPKESHTRTRFCLHAQCPTAHLILV